MTTTIRVTCHLCRAESDVDPAGFVARLDPKTAHGEFLVSCPACRVTLLFAAGPEVMGHLIAAGVTHFGLDEPDRSHPECPPEGPPITYDDLLDWHHQLAGDLTVVPDESTC